MPPPQTNTSSAAAVQAASALRGLDAALLRQWLEAVFADFYNGVFDASFGEDDDARSRGLELLRQARSQQAAILDSFGTELALLLAEPGVAGVVVPISAAVGTETARSRLGRKRLLDAFLRRFARIPVSPSERTLLEAAFERQVLGRLEKVVTGMPAIDACAAPVPARQFAVAPQPATAVVPLEQVERLVSRFRSGGLKLMLDDGERRSEPDAPPVSAVAAHSADEQDARAPANEAAPRRASLRRALLLVALLAVAVMLASLQPLRTLLAKLPQQQANGLGAAGAMGLSNAAPVRKGATAPANASLATREPGTATISRTASAALPNTLAADVPAEMLQSNGTVIAPPVDVSAAAEPAPGITPAIASSTPAVVPVTPVPADAPRDARLLSQITYLLERGEKALVELRLTEPFADSAAANYLAVLAIEPANAAAQQGLTRVVERYSALVRAAVARGDTAQAELLLGRARSVLPHVPQLQELEKIARTP